MLIKVISRKAILDEVESYCRSCNDYNFEKAAPRVASDSTLSLDVGLEAVSLEGVDDNVMGHLIRAVERTSVPKVSVVVPY